MPPYFSKMNRETMDIIIKIVAAAIARFNSPQDMFRYSEIGNVSVFIRVAPASISAAPNSPIALDQVMMEPAKRPPLAIGSDTFQNACVSLQPNVFAAYSYLGFTPSNVDLIMRSINDIFTKN